MTKEIIDYELVSEHEQNSLKVKVKGLIGKGWQPYGDLQVSAPVVKDMVAPLFTQVMVKVKE